MICRMTDEEAHARYTVFAVMLAAPYLNGDHGELPIGIRDDIQATLWTYGYIPAQELLLEDGATTTQVARVRLEKEILFGIAGAEDRDL